MEKIYTLHTLSGAEEYIALNGDFSALRLPCLLDELQHLTRDPVVFGLSGEGGLEVPDALIQSDILFVSDRLKEALLRQGQDQLFFKRADIVDDHFGIHETFWITVPPRISCLDLDRSKLDTEWDFSDGLVPALEPVRLRIDPERAGRYQIFRLLGVADDNIYVRESLYQSLVSAGFEALAFIPAQQ